MKLKILDSQLYPIQLHDGMYEEKARLKFRCGNCGYEFDENLLDALSQGEEWFRSLPLYEQEIISRTFSCRLELVGAKHIPYARFGNNPIAYFVNLSCPHCMMQTVAALDFYEMQPMRYIAIIIGLAEVVTEKS